MTTFYVDAVNGRDSNSGTSPNSAWNSVDYVNEHLFKPGDSILFHRGDIYDTTLVASSSGTANAPITYGAYGNGADPVFTGASDLSNATWKETSPGSNVWTTSAPKEGWYEPGKVLFDGESGNVVSASVAKVDQAGDWYWGNDKLYVYSNKNPANAFDNVEVAVRNEGILIKDVNFIKVTDLDATMGRQGIFVFNSKGTELIDVETYDNVMNGIHLKNTHDSLVSGGSSYDNGIDGTATYPNHLGHGVLLSNGASDNTVTGMDLYDNAEDGLQFGNTCGNDNVVSNNAMWNNREDGVDIKKGDQSLIGNLIYDNAENAVVIHKYSDTITVTNNVFKTQDTGNALDVNEGSNVISSGNWYEGVTSFALQLTESAGNNSSFTNDTIVNGGAKAGWSVDIAGGTGHVFDNVTFIMENDGASFRVHKNAGKVTVTDSIFYTDGAAVFRLDSGKSVILDGNDYYIDGGSNKWVRIDGTSASYKDGGYIANIDDNALFVNPKFVDAAGHDFDLQSNSPVAALGSNPTTDGSTPTNGGGNTGGGSTGGGSTDGGSTGGGSSGGGSTTVYVGTGNSEKIVTGNDNDEIHGEGGNDIIKAGDGNDILYGGTGNDILHGGSGNDILAGDKGNDELWGWRGADTFVFDAGSGIDVIKDFDPAVDTIDLSGWAGANYGSIMADAIQDRSDAVLKATDGSVVRIENVELSQLTKSLFVFDTSVPGDTTPPQGGGSGQTDAVVYTGTNKADKIVTSGTDDVVYGKGGNDIIKSGDGADVLYGGGGNDILHGGNGNDLLIGGSGDDELWGWSGADTFAFEAGSGKDIIKQFETGSDKINLGGWDGATYNSIMADAVQDQGNVILTAGDGSQVTVESVTKSQLTKSHFEFGSAAAVNETPGTDTTQGGSSGGSSTTDTLVGSDGNDLLKGGTGADFVYGGDGADRLKGGNDDDSVDGGNGNDDIIGNGGNDILLGGSGNDALKGRDGNDQLAGQSGRDDIYGGTGDDLIVGGAGNDWMWGDQGADTFVFGPGSGSDKIKDFEAGIDHIDLQAYGLIDSQSFLDNAYDHYGNTILDLGNGDQIELANFDVRALDTDDFTF